MDDMEPPVPQFDDSDGNQNLDVPVNDSRLDSPMNIVDLNPRVKGWLHIDDMEDNPYRAKLFRTHCTPPPDSPALEEAHEMEENIVHDGIFNGPPNQDLVEENSARSPSRTPKVQPIYGYRGLIDFSSRETTPEQARERAPQNLMWSPSQKLRSVETMEDESK